MGHAVETNLVEFAEFRGRSRYMIHHDDGDLCWNECILQPGYANQVIRARLTQDNAKSRINQITDYFAKRGLPFSWTAGPPSSPYNIEEILKSSGFSRRTETPGMTFDLPDGFPPPDTNPLLRIERIMETSTLSECFNMAARGFDIPLNYFRFNVSLFAELGTTYRSPWRYYACYNNGVPVAMCSVFLGRDTAGIYGLTTLSEHRRSGIGTFMTQRVINEACEAGRFRIVLRSTPMAVNIYRRLGFKACGAFSDYVRNP